MRKGMCKFKFSPWEIEYSSGRQGKLFLFFYFIFLCALFLVNFDFA
jgi:hypothetical protein